MHLSRQFVSVAMITLMAAPIGDALASGAADVEEIDTVTIIGKRKNLADVPGSVHLLEAEDLAEFAQSDVQRVLRAVPGVYLQEEEGWGLRPNIGIRGSGLDRSSRVALLEDGVLIAPAPYASPAAYYFPTQRRMSSVEVLKGPSSIAVGPRTTGGAVNLVSTPLPIDGPSVHADLRYGDFNTFDAHLNAGYGGRQFSWLLEGVRSSSDGFKQTVGPSNANAGFELDDFLGKFEIRTHPAAAIHQSLTVKAGRTDQVADETYLGLTDEDFREAPFSRYAASANDVFRGSHSQFLATYVLDPGRGWHGEITAYRNDFQRNWYKLQSSNGVSISSVLYDPTMYQTALGYLRGNSSPDDALQVRANNRDYVSQGVQGKLGWNGALADAEIDVTLGVRLHDDEEDRFQWQDGYRMEEGRLVLTSAGAPGSQSNRVSSAEVSAIFLATVIDTGRWVFTPGVRYEDIALTRRDYATDDAARLGAPARTRTHRVAPLIPGVGVLYRLSDQWRLLAGVHRGFNPPAPGSTATEETSTNWEAGFRYGSDRFSLEAIAFRNDYDNLVGTVTASTGGGGQIGDQFDGGAVRVDGLEVQATSLLHRGDIEIPLSFFYTWTASSEFRESFASAFGPWGDVQAGYELPYIPQHQFRFQTGLTGAEWRLSVAANYVDAVRTRAAAGTPAPGDTLPGYVVWDMIGVWRPDERLSFYLKVDNVLDKTYAVARRPAGLRPGLPRTAYLGLTYRR